MPLKRIVLAVLDRTLTVLRLSVFFNKPVRKFPFLNRFTEVRRSKSCYLCDSEQVEQLI